MHRASSAFFLPLPKHHLRTFLLEHPTFAPCFVTPLQHVLLRHAERASLRDGMTTGLPCSSRKVDQPHISWTRLAVDSLRDALVHIAFASRTSARKRHHSRAMAPLMTMHRSGETKRATRLVRVLCALISSCMPLAACSRRLHVAARSPV